MPRYAVFDVTLSQVWSQAVQVAYATVDGSATAARGDFVPASGTLTFAPGETSKQVLVRVRTRDQDQPTGSFTLQLSSPTNATLDVKTSGTCLLPSGHSVISYLDRFDLVYDAVKSEDNQYLGPNTGPLTRQRTIPKHIAGFDSMIINEAPDAGSESVSETMSFWIGLETWKGYVSGARGYPDWSGYNFAWETINTYFIPSTTNAPFKTYNTEKPADYIPGGTLPSQYPRATQVSAPVGIDPLWNDLKASYSSDRMYLMHWIIDVEGAYGYRNGDGGTRNVFINTYQRGLQESSFETVTHACWNDWNNGGGEFGFEPLFTQGTQVYPAAPFDYGRKWSYTAAPDSEVRTIQWSFWAAKFAAEQGMASSIAASQVDARKMGDYARYALFDKYFRVIGNNTTATTEDNLYDSCHFLINWYVSWGGEIVMPDDPNGGDRDPYYGFLVSCSECHQGYQGLSTAYALATGGGGLTPVSPGAGDVWLGSLYRQIEMIRWLQSPEGPIAGGVTNSINDAYVTPSDGRQNARFYGMDYVYSPVWHDPQSNNWVGFQGWGQGRTADLFLEVSDKNTTLANAVRPNLEIILDRLCVWFVNEIEWEEDGGFKIPASLNWTSDTRVPGKTTTVANQEGLFEYLPSLNWNGTGSYAAFWDESTVPNPNLHCSIVEKGTDLGVAASCAYMLLAYAKAKQNMGKFETTIPNSSLTPKDMYVAARRLLDRSWFHWDGIGICIDEVRADYDRMADTVYVPSNFSGTMPNGDTVAPGATFISIRTFLMDDPMWPDCAAYIAGSGPAPVFRYHRFWAQAEYAIGCAAMHRYFGDYIATDEDYEI